MKNIRPAKALEERNGISPLALTLHVLAIFLCFVGLMLMNFWPDRASLEVGQVSPETILAERRVDLVNETATEEARRRAKALVPQQFIPDSTATGLGEANLEASFEGLDSLAETSDPETGPTDEALSDLVLRLPVELSLSDARVLLGMDPDERFALQNQALHIYAQIMDDVVTKERLEELRAQTEVLVQEQMPEAKGAIREVMVHILNDALEINQIPSPELTQKAKEAAEAAVKPIRLLYQKGEAVVRAGEPVTLEHVRVLEELGLNNPKLDAKRVGGVCLLVASCLGVLFAYLFGYRPDLTTCTRHLSVLGVVMVLVAATCRLLLQYSLFLTPVAIASILITTLMDRRLGLLVTGVMALLIGVMADSLTVCGVSFLTGAVGVLALSNVESRNQMIRATLLVGLSNLIAVAAFELIDGVAVKQLLESCGWGLFNGLISGWIAVGSLPMFENFFGITTHFRLLDLSNMNEPLLRKLTLEAPGTYQHSMMVANLSEQAARAVGADPLLCRVGAYYHDIGKVKRPRFFIENQMGQENPHDKLAPSLSTRIIHSHVKDGVEMAREAGLPDILIDFIKQHHGTNLVAYFYHQACEKSDEPVFEEDFRYPGPRPQSKETAILLLCDGLEAAARTLSQPTPEKIEELVEKMVKHNLDDGQLDESGLSLHDIRIIKETLCKSLQNIYHSRIEYPDAGPDKKKVTRLRARKKSS